MRTIDKYKECLYCTSIIDEPVEKYCNHKCYDNNEVCKEDIIYTTCGTCKNSIIPLSCFYNEHNCLKCGGGNCMCNYCFREDAKDFNLYLESEKGFKEVKNSLNENIHSLLERYKVDIAGYFEHILKIDTRSSLRTRWNLLRNIHEMLCEIDNGKQAISTSKNYIHDTDIRSMFKYITSKQKIYAEYLERLIL
jgi:hypothetical protein